MARTLEQTNRLVDRIATVAAILSIPYALDEAACAIRGEKPPTTLTDEHLCELADELIDAAALYLERRDERERRDLPPFDDDLPPSEPDAMPKNTGKYQPALTDVDQHEIELAQRFLRRVAEVKASPEARTTTLGELHDEVYGKDGLGRMPENTGKHPEKSEKPEVATEPASPDVIGPPPPLPTVADLFDGLDRLLAGKPDAMDVSIARTTVNTLRRLWAGRATTAMVEAVARAFWDKFERVPWEPARYLTAEKYMRAARTALDAATAVARDA